MGKQYQPTVNNDCIEKELEELVDEVIDKQDRIIPVIGDDCFVGEVNGVKVPLQQWLTDKLLGNKTRLKLKQQIYSSGFQGLDLLFEEYVRIEKVQFRNNIDPFSVYKDKVKKSIKEGLKGLSLREDVKKFLEAGEFEVIVTTCPFHILDKEVTLRGKAYNVMNFTPISSNLFMEVSRAESSLKLPAIYQIFGDYSGGDFVWGEEKLLEYLHYLNQSGAEKGFGASPLVKYIKEKGSDGKGLGLLMPIGCSNLPDWIFRFLWYPLSQYVTTSHQEGGIWPNYRDHNFYRFLSKYNFRTFSSPTNGLQEGNTEGDPVLNRLTDEFKDRRNNSKLQEYALTELKVQWNDNEEWDLFISYASEDREFVQTIYDVLTEDCGKKVWMDNRGGIVPGDNYWSAIKYGIEHSSKFLFVITELYLEKAMDKNHLYPDGKVQPAGVYQEIELIKECLKERRKDGQKGYAIPLIVEGTLVTYTDLTGTKHINEPMKNGTLEQLPKSKEYQMMQTDWLFEHIQDMMCSRNPIAIKENLLSVFGH